MLVKNTINKTVDGTVLSSVVTVVLLSLWMFFVCDKLY